jgi:hypothetical protein
MNVKRLGLWWCLLVVVVLGVALELTRTWQLLVIAGVVGGLLAKNLRTAVLSGFLGLVIAWGAYFLAHYTSMPASFATAFSHLSMFLAIGLVLAGLLGLFSALLSYFATSILKRQARR